MALEFAIGDAATDACYGWTVAGRDPFVIDWGPMMRELLQDVRRGAALGVMAATFHNTLADIIVEIAGRIGQERVVLSGGCFQNRYLTERTISRLRGAGFQPYWHRRVPPNDGGIALGQLYARACALAGARPEESRSARSEEAIVWR